jgi:hypothetical protein
LGLKQAQAGYNWTVFALAAARNPLKNALRAI